MVGASNPRNKTSNEPYLTETQAGKLWRSRVQENKTKKPQALNPKNILKGFHNTAKNIPSSSRLALLKDMGLVALEDIEGQELYRRRTQFNKGKHKFSITGDCWACAKHPAEIRHHIIWLTNGGPVLSQTNIVLLCTFCHNYLHPWMIACGIARTVEVGKYKAEIIEILDDFVEGKLSTDEARDDLLATFYCICNDLEDHTVN